MALAVLSILSTGPDVVEAEADLGSNGYFALLVGHRDETAYGSRWGDDEMVALRHPVEIRPAPASRSPLSRRFSLSVPLGLFDREHPHLQLVSFADRDGNNPARSRIFRVGSMLGMRHSEMGDYAHGLPPSTLSLGHEPGSFGLHDAPVRSMQMTFQEAGISRAQFLDSILQAITAAAPQLLESLPQLLSNIAPSLAENMPGLVDSIGGLVGGAVGGGGQPAAAAPAAAAPAASSAGGGSSGGVSNEVLVTLLREMVAALAAQNRGGAAAPAPAAQPRAAPAAEPAVATSLRWHSLHPLSRARNLGRYVAPPPRHVPYARPMDGGIISGPVIASLLGAVAGPLLQRAPQLLGVLADKPLDFLSTIIRADAQNELQREANQQALMRALLSETNRSVLLEQLFERLGQDVGGNAAALLPLLAGAQSMSGGPRPLEATSVTLAFETGKTIEVGGKMKSVFAPEGQGIDLRITLNGKGEQPKSPIPRAIADLTISDPATGKTLASTSYQLREIWVGRPVQLHIDTDLLADLPPQRDLHVSATLRWPTASGRVYGARAHHAICLADGPVFAGFGRSHDEVIDMAHPGDHRSFWNKVWEGTAGTDQNRWEIDVLCRYYLRVTGQDDTNGRMETRIAPGPAKDGSTREITGKMRAGMELSLEMLNAVLGEYSAQLPAAALEALKRADLRADLDQEATTRLRLRGKDGQLGVIWAFPGLKLRDAHFMEPAARDPHGQVTEMRRTTHAFPVPDRIHFLPMRTKR